jgi:SAM-dependent methyltransferase
MNSELRQEDQTRDKVRAAYSEIAEAGSPCCGSCGSSGNPDVVAKSVGYTAQELAGLPEGANMGLSCGNPNALAALRPGEVVLDLGSGGGFDVFIAGRRVGPSGRAIGVDMTPAMLSKARRSVEGYRRSSGLDNVEFRLGEIEHLPVADGSVDVVISNCVINLSPDKPQVWREIARVLRPGGRVAVSDPALLRPLPEQVAGMDEALVGCVAGAALVSDTESMIRAAGLSGVSLRPRASFIDGLASREDALNRKVAAKLPCGTKASDFITSLEITAAKPVPGHERAACCAA